jgi:hypothetical protein
MKPVRYKVESQVWYQVRDQVTIEFWNQVWKPVREQVLIKVLDKARTER